MASVSSPLRKIVKPLLFKLLGKNGYRWFQYRAKVRDIDNNLVKEAEMDLLDSLIKPGDTVIDVGANFGYYAVPMAKLVGSSGKVFAFEPIPETAAVLRLVLSHYKLKQVSVLEKGVGAKNEVISFEVPIQEAGAHSAGQAHMIGRDNSLAGSEVYHPFKNHVQFDCEVVRLDDVVKENVSFIKIDIEGAELFALQGMQEIIKRSNPVILVEICSFFLKGFKISMDEFMSFIKSMNYGVYCYDPTRKKLVSTNFTAKDDRNYILLPENKTESMRSLIAP